MRIKHTFPAGLLVLLTVACGPQPRESDSADGACPDGLTLCGDACVDTRNDTQNCGSCGYDCRAPTANACYDGSCACLGANHQIADECDAPTVCAGAIGRCIVPDYGTTETCDEIEGIPCTDPNKVCVLSWCTVPDCNHPEECDGVDNDCDGHLDATGPVPGPPDPLKRDCYGGDPSEIGVGTCRAGTQTCYYGSWTPQDQCPGEVLPTPETGLLECDGLDNDCNDCVDDHEENGAIVCGTPQMKKTDVTFMIDNSGSMGGTIAAVIGAIGSFSGTYQTASWIRWAIERISEVPPSLVDVYQGLTSFGAFNTALASFPTSGGGTEPTYDAVYVTATGGYDAQLGPDASAQEVYVVFTDENAQTLLGLDEHTVCQAVQARGALLVVFTLSWYYQDWDECALLYPLSSDASSMTSSLDELFQMVCTL